MVKAVLDPLRSMLRVPAWSYLACYLLVQTTIFLCDSSILLIADFFDSPQVYSLLRLWFHHHDVTCLFLGPIGLTLPLAFIFFVRGEDEELVDETHVSLHRTTLELLELRTRYEELQSVYDRAEQHKTGQAQEWERRLCEKDKALQGLQDHHGVLEQQNNEIQRTCGQLASELDQIHDLVQMHSQAGPDCSPAGSVSTPYLQATISDTSGSLIYSPMTPDQFSLADVAIVSPQLNRGAGVFGQDAAPETSSPPQSQSLVLRESAGPSATLSNILRACDGSGGHPTDHVEPIDLALDWSGPSSPPESMLKTPEAMLHVRPFQSLRQVAGLVASLAEQRRNTSSFEVTKRAQDALVARLRGKLAMARWRSVSWHVLAEQRRIKSLALAVGKAGPEVDNAISVTSAAQLSMQLSRYRLLYVCWYVLAEQRRSMGSARAIRAASYRCQQYLVENVRTQLMAKLYYSPRSLLVAARISATQQYHYSPQNAVSYAIDAVITPASRLRGSYRTSSSHVTIASGEQIGASETYDLDIVFGVHQGRDARFGIFMNAILALHYWKPIHLCFVADGESGTGKSYGTFHGHRSVARKILHYALLEPCLEDGTKVLRIALTEWFADKLSSDKAAPHDRLHDLVSTPGIDLSPVTQENARSAGEAWYSLQLTSCPAQWPKAMNHFTDTFLRKRKTVATTLNTESSRGHLVMSVIIPYRGVFARDSAISVVDLAGSELAMANDARDRLDREGAFIHASRLAIMQQLRAFAGGQFVSRDSKVRHHNSFLNA